MLHVVLWRPELLLLILLILLLIIDFTLRIDNYSGVSSGIFFCSILHSENCVKVTAFKLERIKISKLGFSQNISIH